MQVSLVFSVPVIYRGRPVSVGKELGTWLACKKLIVREWCNRYRQLGTKESLDLVKHSLTL
jgi:hypothetical protein